MIRIRAKRDGFRRAGMAHPAEWREYPDDHFTMEQLDALRREPMLQVEYAAGEAEGAAAQASKKGRK